MAVQKVEVTTEWQRVGTGKIIITVTNTGRHSLNFNSTATDETRISFRPKVGDQFLEDEERETYVKCSKEGDSWELVVDGVL